MMLILGLVSVLTGVEPFAMRFLGRFASMRFASPSQSPSYICAISLHSVVRNKLPTSVDVSTAGSKY